MNGFLEAMRDPLMAPIVWALAAGAAAYLAARLSTAAGKVLAVAASLMVLGGAANILRRPEALASSIPWADLGGGFLLTIDLACTPLGMLVLIASAGFSLLITLYSFRAMAGEYWEGKFYAYVIWSLAGTAIVALAGNLLVLLVGWELVTLMLFLMINQGSGDAPAGAAKAYGILGFADACLLLAVALLVAQPGGSANLSLTRGAVPVEDLGAAGYVVYSLILVAALAKAGAVPLHTWIPKAAENAPPSVTAYLPGALDKLLGVYLLVVVTFRMFQPDGTMGVVLLVVGCLTLLGAGLMAVMQENLNRALAFDAVSQVGYMAIGIGAGTWLLAAGGTQAAALAGVAVAGALFHMLNHAIYKCSLFLMSGVAGKACGTSNLSAMGGLGRIMPVTFLCGLVAALAASGVPPLNGFASKWLVFQGALSLKNPGAPIVLVVAVFASALSLALFLKILYAVFLSPRPAGVSVPRSGKGSFLLTAPMVIQAAACVLLGVRPQWALELFNPAIVQAGAQAVAADGGGIRTGDLGLWNPGVATGLILIGIVLGLGFAWIMSVKRKVRVVRPFLSGEVPAAGDDRFRLPATDFYKTLGKLPLIGTLLAQGETGAMDPYYWSGKHGRTFVELLRSLHTGLVSLYVAWCLLGMMVMLAYLLLSARI
ncbi:MAG TPA: hypothetical protein DCX07_14415 [Phycisphaerales bacterium]|nr:hypothetical protein [Phycisphaerales bacterium]